MRGRRLSLAFALLAPGCVIVAPQPQAPGPATQGPPAEPLLPPIHAGEVRFLLGAGQLDEDDWAPTDEPIVLGVEYMRQGPDAWVGFELGSRIAGDAATVNGVDLSLVTWELYGGLHRTFLPEGMVQPYIGAGASLVFVSAEASDGWLSSSDEDVTFGLYAHAGFVVRVDAVLLGLDARVLGATDVDMFGWSGDVDTTQFCLFVGFGV